MLKDVNDKLERNDVAALINNFFINVGKIDRNWVNLGNHWDKNTNLVDKRPYSQPQISEREVFRIIKSINVSKSSGLDHISSSVIKDAFEFLVPEIAHMYNLMR